MSEGVRKVLETLESLRADLERNPEAWENPTLPRYLESMQAWLEASQESSPRELSWDLIVDMLEAARIYE
ncbi:hypothetical protein HJC22_13525 [Corallococcus exiguus]|uniref:DUF7660 family protein n=1 Tax=Corallococcus exiguus TaxID=83462 RepID=UPI0014712D6C|nr:hypothetical protein [Corallococcus exiguus]NNC16737.1 hypothetical protein [Corallococcus exiguus]